MAYLFSNAISTIGLEFQVFAHEVLRTQAAAQVQRLITEHEDPPAKEGGKCSSLVGSTGCHFTRLTRNKGLNEGPDATP